MVSNRVAKGTSNWEVTRLRGDETSTNSWWANFVLTFWTSLAQTIGQRNESDNSQLNPLAHALRMSLVTINPVEWRNTSSIDCNYCCCCGRCLSLLWSSQFLLLTYLLTGLIFTPIDLKQQARNLIESSLFIQKTQIIK